MATTLTISKVKKPWYAWRKMVQSKMKKSIPQYRAITGLEEKYYSLSEDLKYFGGIYFWKTNADAQNWFSEEWYTRIEKTYGQSGTVDFYEIIQNEVIAQFDHLEHDYWSVLSHEKPQKEAGILQILTLKTVNDEQRFLSVWQDKTLAQVVFKTSNPANEFLLTPLLMLNK